MTVTKPGSAFSKRLHRRMREGHWLPSPFITTFCAAARTRACSWTRARVRTNSNLFYGASKGHQTGNYPTLGSLISSCINWKAAAMTGPPSRSSANCFIGPWPKYSPAATANLANSSTRGGRPLLGQSCRHQILCAQLRSQNARHRRSSIQLPNRRAQSICAALPSEGH